MCSHYEGLADPSLYRQAPAQGVSRTDIWPGYQSAFIRSPAQAEAGGDALPASEAVRCLINQNKTSTDPMYCVRVTADYGARGDEALRAVQDNEKTIPTILTTSQKLSTGVDARNVRNIVLMRPVGSMIEFKLIIGRGTRLFDGKDYFTIYDFVRAHHHFSDPEEAENSDLFDVLAYVAFAAASETLAKRAD